MSGLSALSHNRPRSKTDVLALTFDDQGPSTICVKVDSGREDEGGSLMACGKRNIAMKGVSIVVDM